MINPRSKTLRLRLGLTQAQFAAHIRQTPSTVVRLEAGQKETGPQSIVLDQIERDIAEGRLAGKDPQPADEVTS